MANDSHHEELIAGIARQMKPILDKSPQAIYIYLDDTHKVCNKKFADLLGYKSAMEWADTEAPLADVVEADQKKVIEAYTRAAEKLEAGSLDVRLTNVKTGKTVKTSLIMVPTVYEGHIFVMHFISEA